MRKFYDEFFKDLSTLIFFLYLGLAYFDLVDKWVPTILLLDGVLAAISAVYLFIWFYMNRKLKWDFASICFAVFALSMIISSIVGKTNMTRLAVMAFQIVQILTVSVALYSISDRLGPVMWWAGLFAVVFISFGAGLSLLEFDKTISWLRLEFLGTGTNSAGANFGIALLLCLMLLRRKNGIWVNLCLIALAIFLLYAQTLTKSRTAQLSTVLGFVVWGLSVLVRGKKISFKSIALCFIILAIGFVVLYAFMTSDRVQGKTYANLDELTGKRISIWKESMAAMGNKEFFFGFGGNTERMMEVCEEAGASKHTLSFVSWHFLHNIYVQIYVDYGIFALVSFVLGSIYLFFRGFVGVLSSEKNTIERRLLPVALSLASFLTAQNMMESLSLYIGGAEQMVFVTSLALLYVLTNKKDKDVCPLADS